MRLQNLLDDDSAVSPVIGVILMVAITVILAAVIASFVLGLGGQTEVAPTADFSFNYDPGDQIVSVTHSGGASVRGDELYVRGEGLNRPSGESWADNSTASMSGTVEGVSAVVSGDSWDVDVDDNTYVLRVVWESTAGDTSSELATDRGPGA